MVDIAKATQTLECYFANVTKEQFSDDLRKFCPELFEEDEGQTNGSEQDSSLFEENYRFGSADTLRTQSAQRQLDLLIHGEIDRQAKQDSNIEIAAKLLHKGISVKEVAVKMLQENIPLDVIARITELSIDRLQALQSQLQDN